MPFYLAGKQFLCGIFSFFWHVFKSFARVSPQKKSTFPRLDETAREWSNDLSNRTVAEHGCSKIEISCFHKNKMVSIIRSIDTVLYLLTYLNSQRGIHGLKYVCSVISVIVNLLPGNTKNRQSTRSCTARVRLYMLGGERFDLWALNFETTFENVTPSGIGCTQKVHRPRSHYLLKNWCSHQTK